MKQRIEIEKKVTKTGGSMTVILDTAISKVSGIKIGDNILLEATNGKIVITKRITFDN